MSAFDDLKSLIGLAPEASEYTIWRFWNGEQAEDNKRYIVLIENGGPADEDIERPTFNIWFVSRVQDRDLRGFDSDARAISKHLSQNFDNGCLIGVNVVASASGPRPSTDNRFWATMDAQILYSITPQWQNIYCNF